MLTSGPEKVIWRKGGDRGQVDHFRVGDGALTIEAPPTVELLPSSFAR